MRPTFSTGMTAVVVSCLAAAHASGQDLADRLAKKLAEPWIQKASWLTDYDAAKAAAEKRRVPILAYFTRSYAP